MRGETLQARSIGGQIMLPLWLKQSAHGEGIHVLTETLVFLLTHPAQQIVHDGCIVSTSQVLKPLWQTCRNDCQALEGRERHSGSTPDRYRQCLPAGNAGNLPVEVVSPKALVPSISRERDGHVLPHQPTHRMDGKE